MENAYRKLVEQFRNHYKDKFGVQMDDDILYLIIRINEMHKDLKRDINNIPSVIFRTGWDYFLYGVGKSLKWVIIPFSILAIAVTLFSVLK